MSATLHPHPVCRGCLDPLPYDTHDGLCPLCHDAATHARQHCTHTCPECATDDHHLCVGYAWCDVLDIMVGCGCTHEGEP